MNSRNRKRKRKNFHPKTKVSDWGINEIIERTDRAIAYLEGREYKKNEKYEKIKYRLNSIEERIDNLLETADSEGYAEANILALHNDVKWLINKVEELLGMSK